MRKIRCKKPLKCCMSIALALTLFVGISSFAFAAADGTRNNSGASHTRWVGPAKSCKYAIYTDGVSYSGNKKNAVEFKDPTLPHDGVVFYLRHGQSRTGTYPNGSSSAYYRGYVQYGYAHITA